MRNKVSGARACRAGSTETIETVFAEDPRNGTSD